MMETPKNNENTDNNKEVTPSQIINKFAKYSSLAFEMAIIIALFAWGGYHLNNKLGFQKHIITAIASLLGVASALYLTIKQLKNDKKKNSN